MQNWSHPWKRLESQGRMASDEQLLMVDHFYLWFCKSNWAEGYSEKNFGSSVSEGSIAGIAIYTSSVENGMLQERSEVEKSILESYIENVSDKYSF